MGAYPASDWPYTFYFNGEELPKWSGYWYLCNLGQHVNAFEQDWTSDDSFVGHRRLFFLQRKLDNVGSLESEDPYLFRFCSLTVLLLLLKHPTTSLTALADNEFLSAEPELVFRNLLLGTAEMVHRCEHDGFAIWTIGYEADRQRLLEEMERCREWETRARGAEPLHIISYRQQMCSANEWKLKELRQYLQSSQLEPDLRKPLRRFFG